MEKRKSSAISSSEDEQDARKKKFFSNQVTLEQEVEGSKKVAAVEAEDMDMNEDDVLFVNRTEITDEKKVTSKHEKKLASLGGRGGHAIIKPQVGWTRKYIGDLLVSAYTTSSVLLKDNESVSIEYYKPKSTASTRRSKPVKDKESIIVQFRDSKGWEVGRIQKSDAKFISRLIDQEIVQFEGTVVSAPDRARSGSDVILSLRAYILPNAFVSPSLSDFHEEGKKAIEVGWDKPSAETSIEKMLRERKTALTKLFEKIGLTPVESTSISKRNAVGLSSTVQAKEKKKKRKEEHHIIIADSDEEGQLDEEQIKSVFHTSSSSNLTLPLLQPPNTFALALRPYQQQALHWLVSKESSSLTPSQRSIHPLWETYLFPVLPEQKQMEQFEIQEKFYVNPYSGEASLDFPHASKASRGGILADEMGLGKTIQIAALIHHNRPGGDQSDEEKEDGEDVNDSDPMDGVPNHDVVHLPSSSTTRIVSRKARNRRPHQTLVVTPMSLMAQWESELVRCNASTKKNHLKIVMHYGSGRGKVDDAADVVITSYGTLASEGDRKDGLLDRNWYRVVLDEAHNIKSRNTKTARACYQIKARRRFAVTGTPILNRLEDLWSLLHFLRVEPWGAYAFFRTFVTIPFSKGDNKALDIVQVILEGLLLRREKNMKTADGLPIIPLPEKKIIRERIALSKEERKIYDVIFHNSKSIFDRMRSEGSVLKNFTAIFAVLLRLRLCVLHPALALKKGTVELGGDEEDIEQMIEKYAAEGDGFKGDTLKELLAKTEDDESECSICFNIMETPVFIRKCMHKCCRDCILDYIERLEGNGETARCPICSQGPISTSNDLLEVVSRIQNTGNKHGKPATLLASASSEDEAPPKNQLLLRSSKFNSSTKLDRLIWHLKTILQDGSAKVVVFSQFTSFLNIVEVALKRESYSFSRFDGSMSQKNRVSALSKFAETDCPILLASLKAGGVGLNLVAANTVILLDVWWNAAITDQSIDRVHRFGQTRDVKVIVITIEDSIEDRMLAIQQRKKAMVTGALNQGTQESRQEMLKNLEEIFQS